MPLTPTLKPGGGEDSTFCTVKNVLSHYRNKKLWLSSFHVHQNGRDRHSLISIANDIASHTPKQLVTRSKHPRYISLGVRVRAARAFLKCVFFFFFGWRQRWKGLGPDRTCVTGLAISPLPCLKRQNKANKATDACLLTMYTHPLCRLPLFFCLIYRWHFIHQLRSGTLAPIYCNCS